MSARGERPPTLGVILAGGLARRMGGDKPLRRLGGRTLLDHVRDRLAPQCDGLILNANGDPARFAAAGLPVVPDTAGDFAGPLAGVLAALDWAAVHAPGIRWVLSAPIDSPFLPRDLAARLHEARGAQDAEIACAVSGGRLHPVVGLWPVAMREALRHALTVDGVRRTQQWVGATRCARAEWPDRPVDPFFNVNTIEDLAEAERLAPHAEP